MNFVPTSVGLTLALFAGLISYPRIKLFDFEMDAQLVSNGSTIAERRFLTDFGVN
jgi:hypothetical protein